MQSILSVAAPTRVGGLRAADSGAPGQPGQDTVSVSGARLAGGAIGAATGAAVGEVLVPAAAGLCTAWLANLGLHAALSALPAPVGIGLAVVAGVAGLAGGVVLESKVSAGKVVGGMTGAVAGTLAGTLAGAVGWHPGGPLADLTSKFSLGSLPRKLTTRDYYGYETLRHNPEAVAALKAALPGDIVACHEENYFEAAAVGTRLLGARGDYTHEGIVTERGTIIDMVKTGAHERSKEAWLRFTHMAILRPHYDSADHAFKTVEGARQAMAEKTYDRDFSLTNAPDKEYCTEFVANRLHENAPEIHLTEQKFFTFRFETPDVFFKSPDVDVVYNSGSNFWLNHLSRFC